MNYYKVILYILSFTIFLSNGFKPHFLLANSEDIKPWFQKAVLIKSYQQSYDWLNPWQKREIITKSGMALVVDINNYKSNNIKKSSKINNLNLLTTADMVTDATLIEVTRKDILQPYIAKILLIDYAANIALLSIDNLKFWDKLIPVKWKKIKSNTNSKIKNINSLKIKSEEEWNIQSAKVEQMTIGYRLKSNSWFPQLKIRGISRGNQGYPIIQDNKTVGMILEANTDEAKAIPAEMILEFFKHARKKKYESLAHRGFIWEKMPQTSTADYFKIPTNKSGILISRVLPFGTGSKVLNNGDYLTKIGKWSISNEGKINHPNWGPSQFDLLFLDKLKVGDFVKLSIIRNGKPSKLNARVSSYEEIRKTVPLEKVGHSPRYIINGGLLFQELSLNYLYMWGKNWKSLAPMRLRLFLKKNNSVNIHLQEKNNIQKNSISELEYKSRVVLVTKVIPDQVNIGYQNISNAIVLKINDKLIKNLKDVKNSFFKPINNFHRIDFLPGSDRISVILPVNGLNEANKRIKNNFRIPKLQSF